MSMVQEDRTVKKVPALLEQHQLSLIEELKSSAFDLLSPAQVADELELDHTKELTDLVRQGWLVAAPGQQIGPANRYFRWRVEFVKRYKRTYNKK